jgi:large subunit ribosomal protein L24
MQRIRKGDDVMVIAGRDKGKRGNVVKHVGEEHLIVEGVNRVKKHQRPNPMKGQQGGIIDKDMPIHISNIALFNAQTGKPDRVGIKTVGAGEQARKVRIFKSTGELVDPVK